MFCRNYSFEDLRANVLVTQGYPKVKKKKFREVEGTFGKNVTPSTTELETRWLRFSVWGNLYS